MRAVANDNESNLDILRGLLWRVLLDAESCGAIEIEDQNSALCHISAIPGITIKGELR